MYALWCAWGEEGELRKQRCLGPDYKSLEQAAATLPRSPLPGQCVLRPAAVSVGSSLSPSPDNFHGSVGATSLKTTWERYRPHFLGKTVANSWLIRGYKNLLLALRWGNSGLLCSCSRAPVVSGWAKIPPETTSLPRSFHLSYPSSLTPVLLRPYFPKSHAQQFCLRICF